MSDVSEADRFSYVIRLADDRLVLSHRLSEWVSWAPQLEEDMALANVALDLLGQARSLLTYAGEIEGEGNSEDDLAYLREEHEFRSCELVEQPTRHEFGKAIAGLLFFSAYQVPLLESLSGSRDQRLAQIAEKSLKEARYHLEHAASWVIRLGDGTQESHQRMQSAVDQFWTYAGELFEVDELTTRLTAAGVSPDLTKIKEAWDTTIDSVLDEATLGRPSSPFRAGTGRSGVHSEHLGYVLAEMQYIHRLHPGAQW